MKIFKWLLATTLMFIGMFFISACGNKEKPMFSISGVVYKDGQVLSGAVLESEIGNVTTDEQGRFSFDNLTSGITISVSCEGVEFLDKTKTFYNQTASADFYGFSQYNLSGKVVSDGFGVEGVKVIADGIKSGFSITNKNGDFVIFNVAGEVSIRAEKEGFSFFEKTASINDDLVTVNATTSVQAIINGLNNENAYIWVDEQKFDYKNYWCIDDIVLGNVIKPECEGYIFEPAQIEVVKENQQIEFNAYKQYSVMGVVKCGNVYIQGAKVKCGNKIVTTNSNGEFEISQLTKTNDLIVEYENLKFENIQVSQNCSDIVIDGCFDVNCKINFEDKQTSVFVSINNIFVKEMQSETMLENVKYGDIVTFICDDYWFSSNEIIINSLEQEINVSASKVYNLNIKAEFESNALENVKVKVGENTLYTNNLGVAVFENLHGEVVVEASLDGYKFENVNNANWKNNQITMVADKYYNIHGTIHSGDLLLDAVEVKSKLNNTISQNGEFSFENLIGEQEIQFTHNDYNPLIIIVNHKTKTTDFELSYNVRGVVSSGNQVVKDALVSCGNYNVKTNKNGEFSFDNVTGLQNITVTKQGYTFDDISVDKHNYNVYINSIYTIYGRVINDNVPCVATKILLTNYQSNQTKTCLTNENGYYEFNDVSGQNILFYVNDDGLALKPNSYIITESGEYEFNLNGFAISGRVLSGDCGVENALVCAGDVKTLTDENGYYAFALIKKDTNVTVSKDGYTFSPNYISVTNADDGRDDINFTAKYVVKGKVSCGLEKLANVLVKLGTKEIYTDTNGYFEFVNVEGKNAISFEKSGYAFANIEEISSFQSLNIEATFAVLGVISCGNEPIKNVKVSCENNFVYSNANGEFVLAGLTYNSCIAFEKSGYQFENEIIATTPTKLTIKCSYTIFGYVTSSNEPVENALVEVGDNKIRTNENGYYEISKIEGIVTISVQKESYTFKPTTTQIDSFRYDFKASFSVSGNVTLLGNPLKNVSVSFGELSTLTDENGYYILNGISNSGNLIVELNGYSFLGTTAFVGPCNLDFVALFSIKGYIICGNNYVSGAEICLNELSTASNENGYFEFDNLQSLGEIIVKKIGYETKTYEISSIKDEIVIELTYGITINLSGISDYSNIVVNYSIGNMEKQMTINSNSFSINNISGTITISLQKEGYVFSPAKFALSAPSAKAVSVQKTYSVSGQVIIAGTTIPIVGVKVTAGNKECYTNSNGNYTIDGLVGKVLLKGELSYNNISPLSTETIQILEESVQNLSFDGSAYAYFLFQRGYEYFNSSNMYVNVEGTVELGVGGTQQVRGKRKIDSNGNVVSERMNYGSVVLGIDPRVSLLTYYNRNTNEVKYQKVTGDNISSSFVANYGAWNNSTISDYKNMVGIYPYDHYGYIINTKTITSISNISKTSDGITFKMTLNPSSSTVNYSSQMTYLSGQTPSKFNYVYLTYTILDSGFISKLYIEENYNISVTSGTGRITETYLVTDFETVLTDFDLNNIQSSLQYEIKQNALVSNVVNVTQTKKREEN